LVAESLQEKLKIEKLKMKVNFQSPGVRGKKKKKRAEFDIFLYLVFKCVATDLEG